jgi:hypothetical protein
MSPGKHFFAARNGVSFTARALQAAAAASKNAAAHPWSFPKPILATTCGTFNNSATINAALFFQLVLDCHESGMTVQVASVDTFCS